LKIKVGAVSLGCPKNLVDTEHILGRLESDGFEITADPCCADVIIVNTCGFIDEAKEESIKTILEMAEYKQKGTCRALIVAGCLSQRYQKQIMDGMPEIDALIGINEAERISEIVDRVLEGTKAIEVGSAPCTSFADKPRKLSTPRHYAYIRLADGCDNRCSYCAIPDIRGSFRSRSIEDIVDETRKLAESGVREAILVAQDTTRYGEDIYAKAMLPALLRELSKVDGLLWIRAMYFYPERVTDELLDTMIALPKVCRYIDLPIQHVSEKMLRAMHRPGNALSLGRLMDQIRQMDPDFIIRTTVMLGFPGEEAEDFRELKEFILQQPFDRLGAFTYSPQEGTPSAKFRDKVPEDVKQQRRSEIMEIQKGISRQRNLLRIGHDYPVFVEGCDPEHGLYTGRSYGESPDIDGAIQFGSSSTIALGDLVNVRITGASEYDLMGETV
jgi:ribosomal protein S12 methylthiotransferase